MDRYNTPEKVIKLITNGYSGVLCLHGDEDQYPIAVPVSYVYYKDAIYMISDKEGGKLDWIRQNPKAAFVIVRKDKPVPQFFTIEYESVIAKGTPKIIEDKETLAEINQTFIQRFYSQFMHRSAYYREKVMENCLVIRLDIEEMTGKSNEAE